VISGVAQTILGISNALVLGKTAILIKAGIATMKIGATTAEKRYCIACSVYANSIKKIVKQISNKNPCSIMKFISDIYEGTSNINPLFTGLFWPIDF
jgi:hypothetical protein